MTTLFAYTRMDADKSKVYLAWALYTDDELLGRGLLSSPMYETPAKTEIRLINRLIKGWKWKKPNIFKVDSSSYRLDKTLCTKAEIRPKWVNPRSLGERLAEFNYRMNRKLGRNDQIARAAMDEHIDEVIGKNRPKMKDAIWEKAAVRISEDYLDRWKYTVDGMRYTPGDHSRLIKKLTSGSSTAYALVRYNKKNESIVSFVSTNREFVVREYLKEQEFMDPEDRKMKLLYNRLKRARYTPSLIPARYIIEKLKFKYDIYQDILRLTGNGRYPYVRIEEVPFIR